MMLATKLQEAAANSTLPTYIEDVFSTYLYTGNGTSQTITNGIDLAGKGGMLWIKSRSGVGQNIVHDSRNGGGDPLPLLRTDAINSSSNVAGRQFTSSGFTMNGSSIDFGNANGATFASWTFRKQPKFFDVQTATTNGSSSYGSTVPSMTIAHSLGSVPGCVLVKRTDGTGDWYVWHRSLPALSGLAQTATYIRLNTTDAAAIFGGNVNGTGGWIQATATHIYLDAWFNTYEPGTFIVYILAHDAGGFGLTGTDNVISCGSFTKSSGVVASITLGYEPQWLLFKRTDTAENWFMIDNMRGMTMSTDAYLIPNLSNAENNLDFVTPTATGFEATNNFNNGTYIYIAIRRGPMKVPTSGTSVFYSASFNDQSSSFPTGFVTDFAINKVTHYNPDLGTYTSGTNYIASRLTGLSPLVTNSTAAAGGGQYPTGWDIQDGYKWSNGSGYDIFGWAFKRAISFADVVCYTGNGTSGATQNHNLGVVPELVLLKCRSAVQEWRVMSAYYNGGVSPWSYRMALNTTGGVSAGSGVFNDTAPTASVFTLGNNAEVNASGSTYIAYLFATCAGVSKVGSYSGTGSTQTIDCGFASGARFVLIKRTNTTGAWFVYDSSRGIQSGNDPYLLWNDSAAVVTTTNYVDAASTGFQVIGNGLNVSGGTYIFLAIA